MMVRAYWLLIILVSIFASAAIAVNSLESADLVSGSGLHHVQNNSLYHIALIDETALPPVIIDQPADASCCTGGSALFRVNATGTKPLNYQWKKNNIPIYGEISSNLSIRNARSEDAGIYMVDVSNVNGSVTSRWATLTVNSSPQITSQPEDVSTCGGRLALFRVAASGTEPLSYKWYKNGIAIQGENCASLTIDSVSPNDAGDYTADVTNSCGTATSRKARLTYNSPVITTQPEDTIGCEGRAVSFTVVALGPGPMSYQWMKGNTPIPDATSAAFTIPSVSSNDIGTYKVNITNSCGPVISREAALMIEPPPVIINNPSDVTCCSGRDAYFKVSAQGMYPLTYQWKKNGANIPDAINDTYKFLSITPADGGSYTVVVTSGHCHTESLPAHLTCLLPPSPQKPTISPGVPNCGGHTEFIRVQADGTPPFQYQWKKNGQNISNPHSLNPSVLVIMDAIPADEGYYSVVVSNVCGETESEAVHLYFLPPSACV